MNSLPPILLVSGEASLIAGLHRLLTRCRKCVVGSRSFHAEEDGSVAIEYGLIAAFVVVVVIVALVQLRSNLIELPLPTLNAAFDEALS
jgi:Flp pilus assembly pilin Flp